jgi:hypothetical protein
MVLTNTNKTHQKNVEGQQQNTMNTNRTYKAPSVDKQQQNTTKECREALT